MQSVITLIYYLLAHLCILNPADFQLEIIRIVNDYGDKHQPLTKFTKQYSLLLLKPGYASNASCATMLGLRASCSFLLDRMDFDVEVSFNRVGHHAAFKPKTRIGQLSTLITTCVNGERKKEPL